MANFRGSIHDLIAGPQTGRTLRLSFPRDDAPASQRDGNLRNFCGYVFNSRQIRSDDCITLCEVRLAPG